MTPETTKHLHKHINTIITTQTNTHIHKQQINKQMHKQSISKQLQENKSTNKCIHTK